MKVSDLIEDLVHIYMYVKGVILSVYTRTSEMQEFVSS